MSWTLIVKHRFSAAHYLKNYQGKCEKMHGHTFELEVHFLADQLDPSGISIDFIHIKEFLKKIVPDHQVLNDLFEFSPSAENLARHFYQCIAEKYPVAKVIVWESDDAGAAYFQN